MSTSTMLYVHAHAHAVIFDGCTKNMATARHLGCKLNAFDGTFPHPARPNKTIHVILDVCHMSKLVRNALGDKGVFYINGDPATNFLGLYHRTIQHAEG